MKLHYRKMGSGKPLIILHGIFGSSDNWHTLGKQFAETFEVFLVDQRNHGQSPWSDAFGYPEMCEDLLELMKDEDLEKCLLIGHSMGGKTAMFFSQLYPERLEKMIVADIGPQAYPPHHDHILRALNSINPEAHISRKSVEEAMAALLPDFTTRQFLLKNLYRKEDQQFAWRINVPVLEKSLPDIIGSLPEKTVTVPTLFLRGGLSGYIRDEDVEMIQHLFPNSSLETIPDAGHWLHAEKPAEFYKAAMDFLQGRG